MDSKHFHVHMAWLFLRQSGKFRLGTTLVLDIHLSFNKADSSEVYSSALKLPYIMWIATYTAQQENKRLIGILQCKWAQSPFHSANEILAYVNAQLHIIDYTIVPKPRWFSCESCSARSGQNDEISFPLTEAIWAIWSTPFCLFSLTDWCCKSQCCD